MSYADKENYITVHSQPDVWRPHANFHIMNHYAHYIKGTVSDWGCNHGACTLLLLDWASRIDAIYGFDMNSKALDIARTTAHGLQPAVPVHFIQTSLFDVPVEDNLFDFITSFHTLEHIYPSDAPLFAHQMYKKLKPGGACVISIPYFDAYPDPAHVAFYTVDTLCSLFEDAGFETVEALKDNRWVEKDLLTAMFVKPLL